MILPVGMENFGKIIQKKLDFVDKSLFIKEILDDKGTEVVVITRPRRFGKTLNLSMLQHFLAERVDGQATKELFDGLKISQYGNEYLQHQGKYPVVSVTFKDIHAPTYDAIVLRLHELMSELFIPHQDLLSSAKLSDQHKRNFEKILRKEANEAALVLAIKTLMECLYLHYGVKPWLLIDEYDTPIQSAYSKQCYEPMIDLMRGVFGAALKSNAYLEKAVVTGILRVAKESLFSGVNNLEVHSILRDDYSQHFGFTEDEVDALLKKAKQLNKAEEIKQWYNGYQIGTTVIYNPWSIVNCIKQKGILQPYWLNTSDNQLIKDLLKCSPMAFKSEFENLINGISIEKFIDEAVVLQYLNNNPSAVWSLLLMSGYLKPNSVRLTDQGKLVQLSIPNREVANLYRQIIEQWLSDSHGIEWFNQFIDSLLTGKLDQFKQHLTSVITQITSYHDFAQEPEAFYQGLMLGFTASLHGTDTYEIKSNRKSGLGRFDIMLRPKDVSKLEIILELKSSATSKNLDIVAKEAVQQIDKKQYIDEFKQHGTQKVLKIGIGFCGKLFELHAVEELLSAA